MCSRACHDSCPRARTAEWSSDTHTIYDSRIALCQSSLSSSNAVLPRERRLLLNLMPWTRVVDHDLFRHCEHTSPLPASWSRPRPHTTPPKNEHWSPGSGVHKKPKGKKKKVIRKLLDRRLHCERGRRYSNFPLPIKSARPLLFSRRNLACCFSL